MPYVLVNPRDLNRTDKKQLERNNINPDGPIQVATALELSQEQINSLQGVWIEANDSVAVRFNTAYSHHSVLLLQKALERAKRDAEDWREYALNMKKQNVQLQDLMLRNAKEYLAGHVDNLQAQTACDWSFKW